MRQKHCLIKVYSSVLCKRVKVDFFCFFKWNRVVSVLSPLSLKSYGGSHNVFLFLWPIFGPRTTIWDSNKTPPKSLHQNLTPQKPHAEFPNYKNFPESIK